MALWRAFGHGKLGKPRTQCEVKVAIWPCDIVKQTPPDVDHEPGLRLVEQLLIGMRQTRAVPYRQHCVKDVGA
jgi:hypothetical protein